MKLSTLYENQLYTDVLPSFHYVRGFIFAIGASPDIPVPEQWMPKLVQHTGHHSAMDAQQVDRLADALMNELRDVLNAMRNDTDLLPKDLTWQESDYSSSFCQWLGGLMEGHHVVEASWQTAWQKAERKQASSLETLATDLTRCLKLFTTLAKPSLALSAMDKDKALVFERDLNVLAKQVPNMLREYVGLAGTLAQFLPNQFETFVQPHTLNTDPHGGN